MELEVQARSIVKGSDDARLQGKAGSLNPGVGGLELREHAQESYARGNPQAASQSPPCVPAVVLQGLILSCAPAVLRCYEPLSTHAHTMTCSAVFRVTAFAAKAHADTRSMHKRDIISRYVPHGTHCGALRALRGRLQGPGS